MSPNIDWKAEKIHVRQQLLRAGLSEKAWKFGPPKSGSERHIDVDATTLAYLETHRKAQRELRFKAGSTYTNIDLVFAKEFESTNPGTPIQLNNVGQREYARLIESSKVKPIRFHGLRHTAATLLLQAGEPVENVSKLLGHSDTALTYRVYSHVLEKSGRSTAQRMGAILNG